MYDAINVLYQCNVCACKLIYCITEENKSLTAGDNKIFDCCRENKSLTGEDKKPLATVGDLKILDDFPGDTGILQVLELEY